ncbi:MAG: hypothetical protein O2948_03655 [Proteobacteria bacterium]|nr:hypothetical protein [Pseudomonadota bacterium]MDA0928560.1 hypothetical protein [Pseudomonadota bacterium]
MKYLSWGVVSLIFLVIALLGIERLAAERVEVVELHTLDEKGENMTTRLWIVDDEGYQYLRVGADGSGWFSRITNNESIALTRNGQTATYTVALRPDKSERINALMQDKYTWGDTFIGIVVGSRDGSVPIELHPQ